MLEVVACNKPMIVYSCCGGQEEGNEKFIENNNLGIACLKSERLIEEINSLFANNSDRMNSIKKSQIEFSKSKIAAAYADFFIEFILKYGKLNKKEAML